MQLINAYLKAPIALSGQQQKPVKGVPQGGPLSPLLSNIVLNELDWELHKRKLRFVCYADDCQILVGSERAGERVMASLTHYLEQKLKLKVNNEKSAVDKVWNRTFLGFSIGKKGKRIKVSQKAEQNLKQKVRMICRRTRGHAFTKIIEELRESLLGWTGFCSCKTCISTIHGGQSVLRHQRSAEFSERSGQMDTTKIAMLSVEAMGPLRL